MSIPWAGIVSMSGGETVSTCTEKVSVSVRAGVLSSETVTVKEEVPVVWFDATGQVMTPVVGSMVAPDGDALME